MESKWKTYVLLQLLLLFSSFGGICSKFAAKEETLSLRFFMFYGMLLVILMIYAVFWQQIIKKIPLSTAYLNKPIGMVWGILWGVLFFQERLTIRMVIGAIIVLCGMLMVVRADE